MKRLSILTLCSVALAVCIFFSKKRTPTTIASGSGLVISKEWLVVNNSPKTPKADIRPADQTFLTFPEWFLVFSPEEQAQYYQHHTATTFPFMSHTAQIWQSYKIVNDQIKDNFPTNSGYHFMIWVIGTSASAEYCIKAWYETIVGSITDTGTPETEEDRFNARFTSDYVVFIKDNPWYAFNFKKQLIDLWASNPIESAHFFRKIDRRYILTSELLVKYVYGKLIGLGTKQVYDVALPTTAVIFNNDSLEYLPRYDKFANAAMERVKAGHSFKEIAGNNSAILVSLLVPASKAAAFKTAKTILVQPVSSDPTQKRIVVATPVTSLSTLLKEADNEKVKIEHVFDY